MAAEPTTRDALIAEILGDVGRLHDSVESLKNVLPGQTEEVEAKITGLIGLLSAAGDVYRDQLETYTNSQAHKVQVAMENDAQAIQVRFDQDSREAIQAALVEVERAVKNTVQREIAAPVQKVLRAQQQSIWQTLSLCLVSGLIGGLVVVAGNVLLHDKDEAAFVALGKATAASWGKLDAKARTAINAERVQ